MKDVRLAYGRDGMVVAVPTDALVVAPTEAPPLADESSAVTGALRAPSSGSPLEDLVRPGDSVAVVFPDLTRPMPNRTVLPPVLAELARLGAGPERVELLCATGTHRRATPEEMRDLVGDDVARRYRIHDHDARDPEHVEVGVVEGVPVLLDRRYVDADVRIVTGFVEPHFFAGFSGGPKGVCPGLAALETILEAHSPSRIADPRATWTVTVGNPVHDFVRSAAALAPPALSLDVAIDSRRRLTAVFAGVLPDAHDSACAYVAATAVAKVPERFDVVLSTNGGHPLDRNLYQAVKGMAAAERVVRPGGTIVMAAPCGDGIPPGGAFARLLDRAEGPAALARGSRRPEADGWQVQVLDRVLARAEVWLHAEGLTDNEVRGARLRPVPDVAAAVAEALADTGGGGRLCVLPRGPLTVMTVG